MVGAPVSKAMDEVRISMEVEDDRLVHGEERIEIAIGQAVGMFRAGLQLKEVNHVYESNLDIRESFAQQHDRCECLLRGYIARRGHHQVRFSGHVVARPLPYADAL